VHQQIRQLEKHGTPNANTHPIIQAGQSVHSTALSSHHTDGYGCCLCPDAVVNYLIQGNDIVEALHLQCGWGQHICSTLQLHAPLNLSTHVQHVNCMHLLLLAFMCRPCTTFHAIPRQWGQVC